MELDIILTSASTLTNMSAIVILILCAQAVLAQVAFSQCVYPGGHLQALSAPSVGAPCGALGGSGLTYGAGYGIGSSLGIGNGCVGTGLSAPGIEVNPTSGGALPVTSSSAIAPSSLSVTSENAIEGSLFVTGELPFLSAAALEATLPSAGVGIVNHSVGNGITAITNVGSSVGAIGVGSAGIGYSAGYGPGIAGIAPAAGLEVVGGCGCGCGAY